MREKGKRGTYHRYTPEDRGTIGRHASQHRTNAGNCPATILSFTRTCLLVLFRSRLFPIGHFPDVTIHVKATVFTSIRAPPLHYAKIKKLCSSGAQLCFQIRQQRGTSVQKNDNDLNPHY